MKKLIEDSIRRNRRKPDEQRDYEWRVMLACLSAACVNAFSGQPAVGLATVGVGILLGAYLDFAWRAPA